MLLTRVAPKSHRPSATSFNLISFRRTFVFTALAFLLATQTQFVVAQQNSDDSDVIRVNTELLLFPVRIREKRGRPVPELTERDLVLKDADRVTTGVYFVRGADRVALVFALDQSGSLREIIAQQRATALALFSRFSESSLVAVLRFSDVPTLVAPFSKDITAAQAAFDFGAGMNRHTAIFDAAARSVKAFDDLPVVRAERRIVILISDGLDNASRTSARTVIDCALDRGVSFYIIHLPLFEPRDGRLAVRAPSNGFRELAEKTGGKYFLVGDGKSPLQPATKDLTPIFRAIEDDLKSQYLLGFYIAESAKDGKGHTLSVGLEAKDTEYSVGRMGYSRTHRFFVNLSPGKSKRQLMQH